MRILGCKYFENICVIWSSQPCYLIHCVGTLCSREGYPGGQRLSVQELNGPQTGSNAGNAVKNWITNNWNLWLKTIWTMSVVKWGKYYWTNLSIYFITRVYTSRTLNKPTKSTKRHLHWIQARRMITMRSSNDPNCSCQILVLVNCCWFSGFTCFIAVNR